MLAKVSVVSALVIWGSAADAQTTNCHWAGQTWTCDTARSVQLDPSIIGRAYNTPQLDIAGVLERRAQIQAQQREEQLRDSYARSQQTIDEYNARIANEAVEADKVVQIDVGRLLAAGDCRGAELRALAAGKIDLAASAKKYCEAPPSH